LLSENVNIGIYRTIILLVVLYGCETWSLIFREEHILRMSENRALRRIFGPKRDEETGQWRGLERTRSRKITFLESKERPVLRADNLIATCEPIV
jgi:hypothetical protein